MKNTANLALLICIVVLSFTLILTACITNEPNEPNTPSNTTTDDTSEVITSDIITSDIITTEDTTTSTPDVHTHTFSDWVTVKEATCTEKGKQERICPCGEKETQSINMLAHSFGEWVTVKAATCTNTGEQERTCSCGEKETQILHIVAHTQVIDEAVSATCTSTGLTQGSHCSVCKEVIVSQKETPVAPHTYDDDYDDTCNVCGHKRDSQCAHTESEIIKGKDATCTESGLSDGSKCKKCGEILVKQSVISAKGHTEVIDKAVAATCTSTGLTQGKHCSVCNKVLVVQEKLSVVPHTYDDKYDDTCNVCGHKRIAECAHTQTEIIKGKAATCTESGLSDGSKCKKCGEILVKQTVISAKGHTEVIDKAVAATCTSTGLTQGKHCSVCNKVLIAQTLINKLDHQISNGECSVCGYCEITIDFTDVTIYASDYGYNYLGTVKKGSACQEYYKRLEQAAQKFHNDASFNATSQKLSGNTYWIISSVSYADLGITHDEAYATFNCWRYDHPLYYWLASSTVYSTDGRWIQLVADEAYVRGQTRSELNSLLYDVIKTYYNALNGEKSEYLTALAYHDMIVSSIDYAYKSDGKTPEDAAWAHNIVGVLTKKGAVCEGYSRTFQLLLSVSDVECLFVSGLGNGGAHGWNLVKLDDGMWYWFDLTWDENEYSFREIQYNYFGVNSTQYVDWKDAHHGWQTPQSGSISFTQSHIVTNSTPYSLPAIADQVFSDNDIIELHETFTVGKNTYALVGFNKVQLIATEETGDINIASLVEYDGRIYEVVSVGAMDDGYFLQGPIADIDQITSVTVSGGLIEIEMGAFEGCYSIIHVKVLDGVESIEHLAFSNCPGITEIYLPSSLNYIGGWAFAFDNSLRQIHFSGTVAEWNAIEKHQNWSTYTNDLTVCCSDGNIVVK